MTRRPAPFLIGITAVSILVSPGAPLPGLTGGALAAEPSSGQPAPGTSALAVQPADGWYDFGPPATVIEREEIVSGGVTLATLSNGVRLVLKPTNLVDDEVLVNVVVDGGRYSLVPDSLAAAELAAQMFVSAGVGLKTHEQLVAMFGPAASSLEVDLWDPWFNLGAKGGSTDLRPLLEILTAYVSDPRWRFEDLEAAKAAAIENAHIARSTPLIALAIQSPGLLTSGDPRIVRPSEAQIMDVDQGDARRAIENQIRSGALEIAIVGDFDREAAIAMAAGTFGTLPVRVEAAPDRSAPRFPPHSDTPLQIYFEGSAEEQGRMIAWPAPLGLFKSKEEQVIGALLGVMIYRLIESPAYETVRFNKNLDAINGHLSISAMGRPESLENLNSDIESIARNIVAQGVTQDEIERAQASAASDIRAMQSAVPNLYWKLTAMNLRGDRNNWEKARSILAYVEGVTPEEVQTAAARYLIQDRSVEIIAVPEPAPQSQQ